MSDLKLNRLILDTGNMVIRQLLSTFFGLSATVLMARVLGPQGYGMYTLVVLISSMLVMFLNVGLAPANVYYLGRDEISVRLARRINVQIWAVMSITGFVVTAVIVLIGYERFFPGISEPLLWVGVGIFSIQLLHTFLISLLQGKQDFQHYNLALLAPPVILFFCTLAFVWLIPLGVIGAATAFAFGYIVGTIIAWRFVSDHIKREVRETAQNVSNLQLLRYGSKAYISNVLAFFNYRADLFMVNLLLNTIATGVYSVAVQLAERLWMLSSAVSTVLLPRLASLHDDDATRKQLTPLVSRWMLLLSTIMAVVVAIIIKPIILLVFGEAYAGAAQALWLLLPGIVVTSFSRILASDIAARGRPELNTYTSVLVVSVNIVANLLLIPRLGISGAALATSISYTANGVAKLYLYGHITGTPWPSAVFLNRSDLAMARSAFGIMRKRIQHAGGRA